MKVPPLVQLAACSAIAVGLTINLPVMGFNAPYWLIALIVLAAVLFLFPAVVSFVKNQTTVNPQAPGEASTLVTDGVYRISRNPMYVGMLLFLYAFVLWLGEISAMAAVAILFVLIDRLQIRSEEQCLYENFGAAFEYFVKRVPRWLIFTNRG